MYRTRHAAADIRTCRIATGRYTGDGTISNAITGLGFRPKAVWVVEHATSEQSGIYMYLKFDVSFGDISQLVDSAYAIDNRLISLDADGFTVDDDGTNSNPNESGVLYDYLALG